LLLWSGAEGGGVGGSGDDVDDFDASFFGAAPWRFDFFLMCFMSGSFCALRAVSGDYVVGGWSLVVNVRRLVHEGVLCGWISIDSVFLDVLFCVSACVCRKLINVGCVQGVFSTVRLAFTHMVAGGRGNVVYLQSGLDDLGVIDDCFLRFAYQLVVKPGWVLIPTFGGSLPSGVNRCPVCWVAWRIGILRMELKHNTE
jgi:hypothetical protein